MGKLNIISTPIGNLNDITLRAIDGLKEADYILCEDTRVTGRLLSKFGIKSKLIKFTDFNEAEKVDSVIKDLKEDLNIALVSDSGTPLISDPGYKLVKKAVGENIIVDSVPGPSSVITALTISGMPPDKFFFFGYLSKKDKKRIAELETIKKIQDIIKNTAVVFESPYRLLKSLEDIKIVFGEIEVTVCRELTKIHQEIKREKISDLTSYFGEKPPKGEVIILF